MTDLLPDLPGYVHGIKSTNPWVVQCDGCGDTRTGKKASDAILCLNRIEFIPGSDMPGVRMCPTCWNEAGWVDGYYGWQPKK